MNRNIILIALLGLLFVSKAVAQSVTVEAKIDSLQILIGEQAKVQLQVAMDAKQRAIFPAYTDTLVRGVEIIETVKPDTQFLNDRQRMVITQEYIITSFDSALYYLPPMPVTVDGKVYNSKALALKVYSMPVDTLHPDQFFGQKSVMKAPFAWEDWYGLIACSFLALPLLGLLNLVLNLSLFVNHFHLQKIIFYYLFFLVIVLNQLSYLLVRCIKTIFSWHLLKIDFYTLYLPFLRKHLLNLPLYIQLHVPVFHILYLIRLISLISPY